MAYFHKSMPCKGSCFRSKAECSYAHSVKEWKPTHPKLMCSFGTDCHYKDTVCCRIHDGSLSDKIRCAEFFGMKFVEPYRPIRVESPPVERPQVPFVWNNFVASVVQEPALQEDEKEQEPALQEPALQEQQEPAQDNPFIHEEDPNIRLQQEKRMILLEIESLRIAKAKLTVRILHFKVRASDFWEAGSEDMEIDMRI